MTGTAFDQWKNKRSMYNQKVYHIEDVIDHLLINPTSKEANSTLKDLETEIRLAEEDRNDCKIIIEVLEETHGADPATLQAVKDFFGLSFFLDRLCFRFEAAKNIVEHFKSKNE